MSDNDKMDPRAELIAARDYYQQINDLAGKMIAVTQAEQNDLKALAAQRKKPAPKRVLLTPVEVGTQLGIDKNKVLSLIKSGALKAINLANRTSRRPRWKVDPSSLDEFLRDREREAAPTPRTPRAPKRPPYERFI